MNTSKGSRLRRIVDCTLVGGACGFLLWGVPDSVHYIVPDLIFSSSSSAFNTICASVINGPYPFGFALTAGGLLIGWIVGYLSARNKLERRSELNQEHGTWPPAPDREPDEADGS